MHHAPAGSSVAARDQSTCADLYQDTSVLPSAETLSLCGQRIWLPGLGPDGL